MKYTGIDNVYDKINKNLLKDGFKYQIDIALFVRDSVKLAYEQGLKDAKKLKK